jgi:RNA polymerase primary sigma factor
MARKAGSSQASFTGRRHKHDYMSHSGDRGVTFDDPELEGSSTPKESSENFLALYFREMAALSLLKPDEELTAARNIETVELRLWAHLLGHPGLLEPVLAYVERSIENSAPDFQQLRKMARSVKRKRTVESRREYHRQCEAAARVIYTLDMDRMMLLAVLGEVRRVARREQGHLFGHRVHVNVSSRSFRQFLGQVRSLFNEAQRERNEFVKANLRLVVSIAKRFNHGRMPLSDLIQEGNIGLIKAVERFDYKRGYRFSTYASWWIRHAISRALADKGRAVRLPVHMLDAHHKVTRATRELSTRLGRAPNTEELAVATGLGVEKVERLQGYLADPSLSLDRAVSEQDDRRFVEMLCDPESDAPSDRVMQESVNQQVLATMKELKPIEADVLRKRFGLGGGRELTLKEIGEAYKLSRERIRQIQEQALGKIRRALEQQEAV